jgi:8-oxo-dGTP pyrophosphatase MutT (NUDIX family)
MPPKPATIISPPVFAEFPAVNFCCGAGVAIFHVKTERVVICYHTLKHYWFLPKGRRDAGEETRRGAEREGFEEVLLLCFAVKIHCLTQISPDTAIGSFPFLWSIASPEQQKQRPSVKRNH